MSLRRGVYPLGVQGYLSRIMENRLKNSEIYDALVPHRP